MRKSMIVGVAVLGAAVMLPGCRSMASRPAGTLMDAVECRVASIPPAEAAGPRQFAVEIKIRSGERILMQPSLVLSEDRWGTVVLGEGKNRIAFPHLFPDPPKSEEPKLRSVFAADFGHFVIARCRAAEDGRLQLAIRAHEVYDGVLAVSVQEEVVLDEGETRVFKPNAPAAVLPLQRPH